MINASGEAPFLREQFDNRISNTMPITSNSYEALVTSKTPEMAMQFYDQRSVSGVMQAGEQGPMPLPVLHHRSTQPQAGPGSMVTVTKASSSSKASIDPPSDAIGKDGKCTFHLMQPVFFLAFEKSHANESKEYEMLQQENEVKEYETLHLPPSHCFKKTNHESTEHSLA